MNRRTLAVVSAIALIIILIAGFTTGWAWLPPLGLWLDGFVKSPGFGALAAVAAAGVAYMAASRRINHDRESDDAQRKAALDSANEQHWWEVLMWVYDNIDTQDPDKMLRICRALADDAHTDGQKAMLAAIVEERLQTEDGEE